MGRENRHHDLLYNVRLGIRYHMWRQSFFERWHRVTGVISLVGGSASFAAFATSDQWVGWGLLASGVIAVTQALDLMVDTRKYSELHKDLRKKYLLVETELESEAGGSSLDLDSVGMKIRLIEADEPPIRETLMDLCQNQTLIAEGYTQDTASGSFSDVSHFRRLVAHFW